METGSACFRMYMLYMRVRSVLLVSTPVHSLYINAYVFWNKPVLPYLLLRLLPQWWPQSGCTLCTAHCSYVRSHSHVGSYQSKSLSLSPTYVIFLVHFTVYTSLALTCKALIARFRFEVYKFFLFFFVGSWQYCSYHSSQFLIHSFLLHPLCSSCTVFFVVFVQI